LQSAAAVFLALRPVKLAAKLGKSISWAITPPIGGAIAHDDFETAILGDWWG
jgi:hypothetical protein